MNTVFSDPTFVIEFNLFYCYVNKRHNHVQERKERSVHRKGRGIQDMLKFLS